MNTGNHNDAFMGVSTGGAGRIQEQFTVTEEQGCMQWVSSD
jgi:hypothetical protein